MELRHLRYFVAVAEELHFGRAAERLHIVQPALSKQVSALEQELGVQLLNRTKRRVSLTDAGEAFLGEAREVLRQSTHAIETARRAARGEHGRLEIGYVGPAIESILPGIVREYRDRYPDVKLDLHELTSLMQMRRLREGVLDVGFLRTRANDDELVFRSVFRESILLALPCGHPLAAREEVLLEQLADEPFVQIPRRREPATYDRLIAFCRNAGFSPNIVQEAERVPSVLGLVASGVGVAFAPGSAQQLRRAGVVYRALKDASFTYEVVLAHRRDGVSPALHRFLETVDELVPEEPEVAAPVEAMPTRKRGKAKATSTVRGVSGRTSFPS